MNQFWTMEPVVNEHYIPDAQEIAEMAAMERLQSFCEEPHEGAEYDEDGCWNCGHGAK